MQGDPARGPGGPGAAGAAPPPPPQEEQQPDIEEAEVEILDENEKK